MSNDQVSVIMLSQNRAQFLETSVMSVIAQTYINWELLFVDDSSEDQSIRLMMDLKEKDSRIHVSQNVFRRGSVATVSSALKEAKGRWIAFINVGDVWSPDKLARQIAFMEENNYAFSYTKYGVIDEESKDQGVVVGGPEVIDKKKMMKCFWPGMFTVMYDGRKIGPLSIPEFEESNNYAVLLSLSEREDCYLLDECLASNLISRGLFNSVPLHKKLVWRYEAYREVEGMSKISSAIKTIENIWYTMAKRVKYVHKVRTS